MTLCKFYDTQSTLRTQATATIFSMPNGRDYYGSMTITLKMTKVWTYKIYVDIFILITNATISCQKIKSNVI